MLNFWDKRYHEDAYAYGTQPNQFFKATIDILSPGRLLLPAEGEGRNAVYAARKGWQVIAFDFSVEACRKAQALAQTHGVSITYEVSALEEFSPQEADFDLIGLIFTHLPPGLRQLLHQRVVGWVKESGYVVIEAFNKAQLDKQSGGPKNESWLYSAIELAQDFGQLDMLILREQEVWLNEGLYHNGEAMVTQMVARKV